MGYQFEKDNYVVVDPDEIKQLRSERDYSINIERFVPPESIDPTYFAGKSYYLLPQGKAGPKPYALLNRAMTESRVVGLAQVVISNREQLVLLRADGKLLVASVLSYAANVRGPEEFEGLLPEAEVSKQELQLAKMLIDATKQDEPELEQFHDLYNDRLKELVDAKAVGREITGPVSSSPAPTINYMDAIKASLAREAKSRAKKQPRQKPIGKRPAPRKRKTG